MPNTFEGDDTDLTALFDDHFINKNSGSPYESFFNRKKYGLLYT